MVFEATTGEVKQLSSLEDSIRRRARGIADAVRNYGEESHGLMWKQKLLVLSDGREAFLQCSHEVIKEIEQSVLDIQLSASQTHQFCDHISFNLVRNEIRRFERRRPDSILIFSYHSHEDPRWIPRVPQNLSKQQVFEMICEDLGYIQNILIGDDNSVSLLQPANSNLSTPKAGIIKTIEDFIINGLVHFGTRNNQRSSG